MSLTPSSLTANEAACLRWVVERIPAGDVASALTDQTRGIAAAARTARHTELTVSTDDAVANVPDGPLDIRAVAFDAADRPLGFVTIWIEDGLLAMLSFGWVTDEMPDDFPPAESLRLVEPG